MIGIDAVRNAYLEKDISDIGHISGENNLADALTKIKSSDTHMKILKQNVTFRSTNVLLGHNFTTSLLLTGSQIVLIQFRLVLP